MPSLSKLCFITACALAIATGSVAASNIAVDQPQQARNLRAEAAAETDQTLQNTAPQRGLQSFSRPIETNFASPTQGGQGGHGDSQGGGNGGFDQRFNGGGGGGANSDGKAFSISWGSV